MTFDRALDHSFERLTMMAREKRRQKAIETLDLAQLIVAGHDASAWRKKQQQIIDRLNE